MIRFNHRANTWEVFVERYAHWWPIGIEHARLYFDLGHSVLVKGN
jgi:hypothetical protein